MDRLYARYNEQKIDMDAKDLVIDCKRAEAQVYFILRNLILLLPEKVTYKGNCI